MSSVELPPSRFWQEIPMTAFGLNAEGWIAVLPLAAVEQHGPHLPTGVDTIVAEALVAKSALALDAKLPAVFLPVQAVGLSSEHLNFAGTVTVGWEAAIRSWIEIGESVARAGISKLIMITSHGGNHSPMDIVARELRLRHGMLAVTTSWEKLGDWRKGRPVIDIHGGEIETSIMLALRPDLVDMGKAKDFKSRQSAKAKGSLGLHSSDANIAWLAEDLSSSGVVGNSAVATADKGETHISAAVSGFCQLIAETARAPLPGKPR